MNETANPPFVKTGSNIRTAFEKVSKLHARAIERDKRGKVHAGRHRQGAREEAARAESKSILLSREKKKARRVFSRDRFQYAHV